MEIIDTFKKGDTVLTTFDGKTKKQFVHRDVSLMYSHMDINKGKLCWEVGIKLCKSHLISKEQLHIRITRMVLTEKIKKWRGDENR